MSVFNYVTLQEDFFFFLLAHCYSGIGLMVFVYVRVWVQTCVCARVWMHASTVCVAARNVCVCV